MEQPPEFPESWLDGAQSGVLLDFDGNNLAASAGALPLTAARGDGDRDLTIFLYDRPLESLNLESGPLEPDPDGVLLPPPAQIYGLEVRSGEASGWTERAEAPTGLPALRFKARPCASLGAASTISGTLASAYLAGSELRVWTQNGEDYSSSAEAPRLARGSRTLGALRAVAESDTHLVDGTHLRLVDGSTVAQLPVGLSSPPGALLATGEGLLVITGLALGIYFPFDTMEFSTLPSLIRPGEPCEEPRPFFSNGQLLCWGGCPPRAMCLTHEFFERWRSEGSPTSWTPVLTIADPMLPKIINIHAPPDDDLVFVSLADRTIRRCLGSVCLPVREEVDALAFVRLQPDRFAIAGLSALEWDHEDGFVCRAPYRTDGFVPRQLLSTGSRVFVVGVAGADRIVVETFEL